MLTNYLQNCPTITGKAHVKSVFLPEKSLRKSLVIDLPLWDLVAKIYGLPLYKLLGAQDTASIELYVSSIYIDDLMVNNNTAVEIFHHDISSDKKFGY